MAEGRQKRKGECEEKVLQASEALIIAYPKYFKLRKGGKGANPGELTLVSDSGE